MLYDDGVANRLSAPSRASAACEGGGEASVGVVQAAGSSREMYESGVPTLYKEAEGHDAGGVSASCWGTLRGHSPVGMYEVLRAENREAPVVARACW